MRLILQWHLILELWPVCLLLQVFYTDFYIDIRSLLEELEGDADETRPGDRKRKREEAAGEDNNGENDLSVQPPKKPRLFNAVGANIEEVIRAINLLEHCPKTVKLKLGGDCELIIEYGREWYEFKMARY